jgi:hypothetical protein
MSAMGDGTSPRSSVKPPQQQTTSGPEPIEAQGAIRPKYGLITSQTCDIAEDENPRRPKKPWVQIAPVFDASGHISGTRQREWVMGGRFVYLIHLPALPNGLWVADLRIEVPVEKGWLAGQERVDGFGDEVAQREVARRLSWIRCRPAFGRRFVTEVQIPLTKFLEDLEKNDEELFTQVVLQVEQVGVLLDSLLDPRRAQLVLLTSAAFTENVRGAFEGWWTERYATATAEGLELAPLDFRHLDDMKASEYLKLVILPLGGFTPEAQPKEDG